MPTTITSSIGSPDSGLGDYLDEVKVTNNTEVAERRGTNGAIKKVNAFNPTNDFSFKGGGDPATAVGVATLTITGLSGGVKVVKKYEHTLKSTDFDESMAEGTHYPGAS